MNISNQTNRRTEVTEAAWRVIIKEGLDRASLRAIAQELGCTTGVVTHYFRGKDELTLFALERVFDNLFRDMATSAKNYQGLEKLEKMMLAALPLKSNGIQGWQVWVAFLGYAVGREKLIIEHKKRYERLYQLIYQELENLQNTKLVSNNLDLELEANALIAFVDGIGIRCVIDLQQMNTDRQKYLVKRYIANLTK